MWGRGEEMINNRFSVVLAERLIKISRIAEATGISRTTLTNLYYRKSKGIAFDTLEKLCDYLECEVDDLIRVEKKG